jgi:hypothetical protein
MRVLKYGIVVSVMVIAGRKHTWGARGTRGRRGRRGTKAKRDTRGRRGRRGRRSMRLQVGNSRGARQAREVGGAREVKGDGRVGDGGSSKGKTSLILADQGEGGRVEALPRGQVV